MTPEEKDMELMDRYLNGELSAEESKEVELRLDKDDVFAQLKSESEDLIEGIRFTERNALKNRLAEVEASLPPFEMEAREVSLYRKPLTMGIAASLAILFIFIYLFNQDPVSTTELYAQHFEIYPNIVAPTVRGETAASTLREQAYSSYDQGQYDQAIDLLQQVSKEEDEGAAYFYIGICQMALDQHQEAIRSFTAYKQSGFQALLPQANWYLGLSHLKLDQPDQARAAWAEIPPDSTYGKKIEGINL